MSLSAAGMLVAIGVVYGDIGTSPLYVMQAIISGNGGLSSVSPEFIYGALSLVVWTLTLITTIKYVIIVLRADNHGEGGVFSLYSLVRQVAPWLVIPAIIGGATTLADGILTPAVTVTSAVEGLKGIPAYIQLFGPSQTTVVGITIGIICFLFLIQRSGTDTIGKLFGPIMLIWFGMLAVIGLMNIGDNLAIFKALSPVYGIRFLFSATNKAGVMLLGSVFLATTGAEALYADLGHVGRVNIYGTWPWIKIALILNYFGQGAWLLRMKDDPALLSLDTLNPFFAMMPIDFRIIGVLLATAAAIIASQALITGSYSIVSEAIMLDLMPRLKIVYPAKTKGQLYIPIINATLWILCLGVVLFFRSSEKMESAYGLAITVSMLMTTILLYHYLIHLHLSKYFAIPIALIFAVIELAFTLSSLTKFLHGGYVTVILALSILSLMVVWWRSKQIERSVMKTAKLENFIEQLGKLRDDHQYPVYATNLVYLTSKSEPGLINDEILFSILDKRPKRADIYWFINVQVINEPQALTYSVENYGTDYVFKINLWIGFNVKPLVGTYLRQIVDDLMEAGELKHQHRTYSTSLTHMDVGDFCFILLRKELPTDTALRTLDQFIMRIKYVVQKWTVSPIDWFGLEFTDVKMEYIPVHLESSMPEKPMRIRAANTESPKVSLKQRKSKRVQY